MDDVVKPIDDAAEAPKAPGPYKTKARLAAVASVQQNSN